MNKVSHLGSARNLSLDQLVQHDRVHGSVYLDQELFEQEIEKIFTQYWVFIGHAGEIPKKGDFRQRHIGKQPVIFLRDENDQIQVLMNRCMHRGNAICHLERGNAAGFSCPYHGWRYRLSGELMAVPYADRYEESFDKSQLGLRPAAKVGQHRGFVFATLNPNACSLEEHLGPLAMRELDDIADLSPAGELDVTAGYHRLKFAGNWKLGIENVIDGYHANFAHRAHFESIKHHTGFDPTPLGSSSAPARVHAIGNGHAIWDSRELNKYGTATLPGKSAQSDVRNAYLEMMHKAHGKERTDHVLEKQGSHLYIFPNFSYVGMHFRIYRPVAVDKTELTLFPFLLKGAPREMNRQRLRAHEVFYGPTGSGQSDDIEVFERNQIGLSAEYYPWALLKRGIHLERQEPDGSVSNQITDELSNRIFWARWKDFMRDGKTKVAAAE